MLSLDFMFRTENVAAGHLEVHVFKYHGKLATQYPISSIQRVIQAERIILSCPQ